MIHRPYFFQVVRGGVVGSRRTEGFHVLLDYYDQKGRASGIDDRMLAYILATTWHETAFTMRPIAEIGRGKGRKYGVPDPQTGQTYYGRGYVQLTWKANYEKMDRLLGLDGRLVRQPDLAMDEAISTVILFEGMRRGSFTGKKLADYFTDEITDFHRARQIVNALDKAAEIAKYAQSFAAAITHTAA